ncbi:UNVERIFIED_CONTAM: hypothetical protein GTU68_024820 [Idotea baltica]|nr:hypothetical protein [Idotea baltica]
MKISYNWLKDYLGIDLDANKVSEILTEIGLEVEGLAHIEAIPGGLQGIIVGEILSVEKVPDTEKLQITSINIGGEENLPIVCGAPNVTVGQKVAVATVGSMLHPIEGEPFKIKKSKIRGQLSMGMLCAEDEIGLGAGHDGIMELDPNAPVGAALKSVVEAGEDDYIFDIGLTPNRSDATGHFGVAKDLAAYLRFHNDAAFPVDLPSVEHFKVDNNTYPIAVKIEDELACPRYSGITISNVTVKESPKWLQERLLSIGLRPINNIVDITNFILHELGQPLHAFDADKIDNRQIIVRKANADEHFVTLDEKERSLTDRDLMICNSNGGMCIAGVFGGVHSGVTESTKHIFLESACFEAIGLRKTSSHHNLRTDAAMRFEKGTDPNFTVYALKRAILMIQELAGGEISSEIVDVYPKTIESSPITVNYDAFRNVAGTEISNEQVLQILNALEIEIINNDEQSASVKVPTNKVDVLREVDVWEELLRIYGYNNIPIPTMLKSTIQNQEGVDKNAVFNQTAEFLVAKGFFETMSTSISNDDYYKDQEKDWIPLLNSLSSEHNIMRKDILHGGLKSIGHNLAHNNKLLKIFEFGSIYQPKVEGGYKETEQLGIFMSGAVETESWQTTTCSTDFYNLKKIVVDLLRKNGVIKYQVSESSSELFAYGLDFGRPHASPIATIGQVKNAYLSRFNIEQSVFAAIIDWKSILKAAAKNKVLFSPIGKYPSVRRDLALLLDQNITFEAIERLAKQQCKPILKEVNLFDIYVDAEKLGDDKKSYAISLTFNDPRKTLTDKEIDKLMSKLTGKLKSDYNAVLR